MPKQLYLFMGLAGAAALNSCSDADHPNPMPTEELKLADMEQRLMSLPRPPESLVDQAERAIVEEPCVGPLDRWDRLYSYGIEGRMLDQSVIAFGLREAGRYDFRAGRRTTYPYEWVNLDDGIYDFVAGSYDVESGALEIEHCGPNVPVRPL